MTRAKGRQWPLFSSVDAAIARTQSCEVIAMEPPWWVRACLYQADMADSYLCDHQDPHAAAYRAQRAVEHATGSLYPSLDYPMSEVK